MRPTYQISFNSSDYFNFTPSNNVTFTTKNVTGTAIYETEANEIRINKHTDPSVYTTLEEWFYDPTKYGTVIRVRQYKGATLKYSGVFGIKQGKINSEHCYYEFKLYQLDAHRVIKEMRSDYSGRATSSGIGSGITSLYMWNEDGDKSERVEFSVRSFKDYVLGVVNKIRSTSILNYGTYLINTPPKSSYLWFDTYPDGSTPPLQYHKSELASLALTLTDRTLANLESVFKYLNCWYYIDENNDFRIEHLSYFEDLIADHDIDMTGETQIVPEFEFITDETFMYEKFNASSEYSSRDFNRIMVRYLPYLTTYRDTVKEIGTDLVVYLDADGIGTTEKMLTVTNENLLAGFRVSTFNTLTYDPPSSLVTAITFSALNTQNAVSNKFAVTTTYTYAFTMTYTSGAGNIRLQSVNSNGTNNGSAIVLNEGANAGTISIQADGWLRIEATDTATGTGDLKVTRAGSYRVPWSTLDLDTTVKPNVPLTWYNVLTNYHQHGRMSMSGYTLNASTGEYSVYTEFDSTIFNKRLKSFKKFYPDDIDPLHGVLTDYGTGKIESYTRDDNDFVEFNLIFKEDE
jgi:hypothetical protein